MVSRRFVVMPVMLSSSSLWVTSSSLSSICFGLCKHGRAHEAYEEAFAEANVAHCGFDSDAIHHHRRQGGHSGSSVVRLWHQQRAHVLWWLAAAEVTRGSRPPCAAPTMLLEKAVASGTQLVAGKLLFFL